jgi:hypothetical protein
MPDSLLIHMTAVEKGRCPWLRGRIHGVKRRQAARGPEELGRKRIRVLLDIIDQSEFHAGLVSGESMRCQRLEEVFKQRSALKIERLGGQIGRECVVGRQSGGKSGFACVTSR